MEDRQLLEGPVATALITVDWQVQQQLQLRCRAAASLSIVGGFAAAGPLTTLSGAMGAGYGGTGQSLTYEESAYFTLNTGPLFLLHLLDNTSLGNGFDNATFKIFLNGNLFDSELFSDLASAQLFFSHNVIAVHLVDGLNNVQLLFTETMISAGGFGFNYSADAVVTPITRQLDHDADRPRRSPFVAYRNQRRNAAVAAG
jgi:hypothetical protein